MMMPPQAPSIVTASSVVGVEASPMLTTSNPMPISVPHTTFLTISPEMRASRPTTMVLLFTVVVRRINAAYADVNFTMSNGFSVSPTWPPIVPRMPEIDLISVIIRVFMCIIEFHNNFTWGKDRYKNNKRRTSPKKFLVEIY